MTKNIHKHQSKKISTKNMILQTNITINWFVNNYSLFKNMAYTYEIMEIMFWILLFLITLPSLWHVYSIGEFLVFVTKYYIYFVLFLLLYYENGVFVMTTIYWTLTSLSLSCLTNELSMDILSPTEIFLACYINSRYWYHFQ